ncbi:MULTISPECIES: hypothetical protein [unclassified Streptomyces]|uniref:hypothetical protein n=1 Tax=unclassified Streptomyces TaxID=2593676 RepID=UPI0036E4DF97
MSSARHSCAVSSPPSPGPPAEVTGGGPLATAWRDAATTGRGPPLAPSPWWRTSAAPAGPTRRRRTRQLAVAELSGTAEALTRRGVRDTDFAAQADSHAVRAAAVNAIRTALTTNWAATQ